MMGRSNIHQHAAAALRRRALAVAPVLTEIIPTDFLFPTNTQTSTSKIATSLPSSSKTILSSTSHTSSSTSAAISSTKSAATTSQHLVSSTLSSTFTSTSASKTSTLFSGSVVTQSSTVYQTVSSTPATSHTAASVTASSSVTLSPSSTSRVSAGAIVGGVIAGIIAVAVIAFAITFILRRTRKRSYHEAEFNAREFRKSAVLMTDPPTHEDTIIQGYNSLPPSMMERRLASPTPTFGTQYGVLPPTGNGFANNTANNGAGGSGGTYPSSGHRLILNPFSPPPSASSANPLFQPGAYGSSSASSVSSPVSPLDNYGSSNGTPYLSRKPSTNAILSRNTSVGSASTKISRPVRTSQHDHSPDHQLSNPSPDTPDDIPSDYIDLSRSSVSPFQAAQYAEISKRLNTPVPGGLNILAATEGSESTDVRNISTKYKEEQDLPPIPAEENEDLAVDHSTIHMPPEQHRSVSNNRPVSQESVSPDFDFPVPPSPATTFSSRFRVDSTPPTLPEINIESRVSVSSYGGYSLSRSFAYDSPVASGFPSGITVVGGRSLGVDNRFPATPSPLASSFGMPTPPAEKRFDNSDPRNMRGDASRVVNSETNNEKKRDTVYSVYNPEDAYGGI